MTSYETKTRPTLYFIGVTTAQSSIMRVFPDWMRELGRPDVAIEGVDIELDGDPARYCRAVGQIRCDPLSLGALVTSHKLTLLAAARDLFDELDPYAATCHEVSSISKRAGRVWGHAKDPITCAMSLAALIEPGHFGRTGAHVLCLGSGGAATALALALAGKSDANDRPSRFLAVDRVPARLDALRRMVNRLGSDIRFEFLHHQDPLQNDAAMAALPEGSLVVNATGMGKDLPGSPITDAANFPEHGIAWELNYRGELDFLHQALRRQQARRLTVSDGWLYFLHGWTQVIAEVLHLEIDGPLFDRLSAVAAPIRPRGGTVG
jgi:shikimate dehydrogenase